MSRKDGGIGQPGWRGVREARRYVYGGCRREEAWPLRKPNLLLAFVESSATRGWRTIGPIGLPCARWCHGCGDSAKLRGVLWARIRC